MSAVEQPERSFRSIRGELALLIEGVLRRQIELAQRVQTEGSGLNAHLLTDDQAQSILRLTQAFSTLTMPAKGRA